MSRRAFFNNLLASKPGVERVPDPLAQQVIAEDGDQDGEPRIEGEPPGDVDVVLPRREDVPPARRGRLDPDAEEAQGGLREDRARHAERRRDQDRRHRVREDMEKDDPRSPAPITRAA